MVDRLIMKIYGPYLRKDKRKHMTVIKDDGKRTSLSYPKWIMQNELGRELVKDETVDHINGDITDNRFENFQILSLADNIRKSHKLKEIISFNCPVCNKEAHKPAKDVRANKKKGRTGPFCGRKCAGKY